MKKRLNPSFTKIALAAVAVGLAESAHAAYVNFTNDQKVDAVKLSDLTNEVNWVDGLFPTSDKEYRVHSGRYAGVGNSLSFPGKKLTIGQKDGSNGNLVIRGAGSTIGFQNEGLFLERGQLYFNQGYQTHSITGNITITAPTSKPFSIFGAWQWNITCNINGPMFADTNCALMVYNNYSAANGSRNDPSYVMNFNGDMSGFKGLLNLGGDNTGVGYAYSTVYMLDRSLPGKVKVTEPGRLYLIKGTTVGSFLSGSMELMDKSTIRLGVSDSDASSVMVTNSFIAPSAGYAFVDLLRTTMASALSTTAKRYTLFMFPEGTDIESVRPKLYVRTSSQGQNGTNYLGAASIVCGTDDLGRPTLSLDILAQTQLTNAGAYGESPFLPQYGGYWDGGSAGSLPDTSKMFVVSAGRTLRSPYNVSATFPGRALLLRVTSQLSMNGSVRVDDFRLNPTAVIESMAENKDYTISGNIRTGLLDDPGPSPATIRTAGNSHLHIASKISGAGDIVLRGHKTSSVTTSQAYLHLEGDNSDFSGKFSVVNALNPATARSFVFASSSANLGGAMRQFTADGINLSAGSELVPTATFALNEPTRGLYIDGSGVINVTNATDVFTVDTTITYAGTLEKKGRGTLKLASVPSVVGGTSPTLNVTEGSVATADAEAFKGLDVDFASGTSLVVPCGGDGIDLTKAASFTWSGDAFDVRIDMSGADAGGGDIEVPLLTVASGDAATYLAALRTSIYNAPKGLRLKGISTAAAGDGVMIKATVGRIGFVVIFN